MPLLNIFCGETLIGRVNSEELPQILSCQPVGRRKPDITGKLSIYPIPPDALSISPCQVNCRLGRKEFRFELTDPSLSNDCIFD